MMENINAILTPVQNEEGSVMVMVLLVLAALTIIGIASTSTSNIELGIIRNEQIYQTNFYQAEAAANEAAQRIEFETLTFNLIAVDSTFDWMNPTDAFDFFASDAWKNNQTGDNSDTSLVSNDAAYSAVSKGVRAGSSLDLGATRLYEYAVFGKSNWNGGESIVEIGYLKRF